MQSNASSSRNNSGKKVIPFNKARKLVAISASVAIVALFLLSASPFLATPLSFAASTSSSVVRAAPPYIPGQPGATCNATIPCPMGVVDYGITPSGSTYSYTANGTYSQTYFNSLTLHGCTTTSNGKPVKGCSMSDQLNAIVEDLATCEGSLCLEGYYWTQDVFAIQSQVGTSNTFNVYIYDNIWNFTSAKSARIYVKPTGTCIDGSPFPASYPEYGCTILGKTIQVQLPFVVDMSTLTYVNSNGSAVVSFSAYIYNTATGQVYFGPEFYDTATFPPCTLCFSGFNSPVYIVGGSDPHGPNYIANDLGGIGGTESVTVPAISVSMSTDYILTGFLFPIPVPHAWSEGGTGETVSNVHMVPSYNCNLNLCEYTPGPALGVTGTDNNIPLY